jgi:hypothetical protein
MKILKNYKVPKGKLEMPFTWPNGGSWFSMGYQGVQQDDEFQDLRGRRR